MKNIQLIQEIGTPVDDTVYIDLINGKFAPTERLKTMHYFAFESI